MTLDECRAAIGRRVIYTSSHNREEGVIVSVNLRYAFVLYGGDRAAKATRPDDLRRA